MAVERPETIGPHLAEAETKWRAAGSGFLAPRGMAAPRGPHSACRVGWGPTGEESCGWPLRGNDRGEAGLRSDIPNRAAEGLACRRGSKGTTWPQIKDSSSTVFPRPQSWHRFLCQDQARGSAINPNLPHPKLAITDDREHTGRIRQTPRGVVARYAVFKVRTGGSCKDRPCRSRDAAGICGQLSGHVHVEDQV